MKTLIASLLIAVSISTTSFAQSTGLSLTPDAIENTQFLVVTLNTGKIDVTVLKSETKNLVVKLIDSNGNVLVSKPINKQILASRTRFDLNELPDGVYHVELIEGNNRQVKDIKLNTHEAKTIRTVSLT